MLLVQELSGVAAAAGIPGAGSWQPGSSEWIGVWRAICSVWSSKWNDRAWLSRKATGVEENELYMSVLLQQVGRGGGGGRERKGIGLTVLGRGEGGRWEGEEGG